MLSACHKGKGGARGAEDGGPAAGTETAKAAPTGVHAPAAPEEKEARDGGAQGPEVEAEYTPRHVSVDEEECDEVARDVLVRLRTQVQEVEHKSAALRDREEQLSDRDRALKQAEKRLEDKIAALTKLRAEIEERMTERAQAAPKEPPRPDERAQKTQRAARVTQVVGGMTAQRAARMLTEFKDQDLAITVLQSLPKEQAARVLGQMSPEAAARLAEKLSGDEVGSTGAVTGPLAREGDHR